MTATVFNDTGLAPATQYSWTVTAVDAGNAQSAPSIAAVGTTTGAPPAAATCYRSSNYVHTTWGRAYQSGGYAYASGSGQKLGLWNIFTVNTLKTTGGNYYVVGTCP